MAFTRGSLPKGLRLSLLSCPQSSCITRNRWAQHPFKPRFNSTLPSRRFTFHQKSILFLSLASLGALYLIPRSSPQSLLPSICASPILIPERRTPSFSHDERTMISSPTENRERILTRIMHLLREQIWEPIRTATRFIHLLILFTPVIITTPMLFVGTPDPKLHGDKWGAIWWYGLLVKQMEAAGPTFTKVRPHR